MMYRPKSSTLSILERAQGQLSGKRFGKKPPSTWGHEKDEPDEEEDELKAYLSQLQKRTTKAGLNGDISDDNSDEVYQPKTSTPLKNGSQFLKSNRAGKPSHAPDRPIKNGSKQETMEEERRRPVQSDSEAISDDDIDGAISDDVLSVSEGELGLPPKTEKWRKTAENLSKVGAKDKSLPGSITAARGKSTAFNRIMSNLGSDEDDIIDMINSIDSNSSSLDVPVKEVDVPTKHVNVPMKEVQPVKAASPLPESISQPTDSPIVEDLEEVASISEVIPTDTSDSSQGEIKLNIFQAEDLQPAVGASKVEQKVDRSKKVQTDRKGGNEKRSSGKQAWLEEDEKEGKTKDSGRRSKATEEIKSDIESEINTVTESEKDPVLESDGTHSDEETDVIASSYSSIASHRSSASTSRSSKTPQDARRSSESDISARKKTPRSGRSRKHSTTEQSLYSEDFDSDTYRTRSAQSSGTLTPAAGATPKYSPTPPPATPSPAPKKTRSHRLKDTGVQTSNNVPYNQGHWIFADHGPPGRSIDVSELTKDFKTTSVAPETLHALTSINYTSLLLQQTLKMQFQQTQQSIERMLRVHQSLLESVQSDYKYTTLEDTKAYIQRQRENGKR